jgi:hypothetical protein
MVKPLVDAVAKLHGIAFQPKSSDLLRRLCGNDDTAQYIFDSFVTASTAYQNCGGFVLTNSEHLEAIYAEPSTRGDELLENQIFVFALEGDGSFFGFGLQSRIFYIFDYSNWMGEELPWDECVAENWTTQEFCKFFEQEYGENA